MSTTVSGLLLIAITGLLWAVVGVLYSTAGKRGLKLVPFGLALTVCSLVFAWAFICKWPSLLGGNVTRPWEFTTVIALGGVTNWLGMPLLMEAMRRGHRAGSWTVSQSAMLVPFLAGVLFWHDKPSAFNFAGVGMVLVSLLLFGVHSAREEPRAGSKPWFYLALMALGLIGISQTLNTVPSHWSGWTDSCALRIPVFLSGATVCLLTLCAVRREWPGWPELRSGIQASFVGVVSTWTLFRGMDRMATRGLVSLVYPLAVGICIVGFGVYTRMFLKEPLGVLGVTALGAGVVGIICIGLG